MSPFGPVPSHGDWLQTFGGTALDLRNPTADMIDITDIAIALSRVNRFNGHTRTAYSVAQHSLVVAQLLRDTGHSPLIQLQGLLHDAPEAYIADLPKPVKRLLPQYAVLEDRLWAVIAGKFQVPVELDPGVKNADELAVRAEAHSFLIGGPVGNWAGVRPTLPADADDLMQTYHLTTSELAVMFVSTFNALTERVQA